MSNLPYLHVYRTARARGPRGDLSSLRRRVEAATELARLAFVERDAGAWEVVQALLWRIHRDGRLRPTEPGDVAVLDAIYAIEEGTLPEDPLEPGLSPAAFCERLAQAVSAHSSSEGPLVQRMLAGNLSAEDWRFFGYQWLSSAMDFTRQIALAATLLPRRPAGLLVDNLYDEYGRGVWERAHWNHLARFLVQFGVEVDDEEAILAWTAPEVLAMANLQNRLLWHLEPGWALGSLYLSEKLVPSELGQVRTALQKMQVQQGSMAFFDEHVELDVQHADDWKTLVETLVTTHEEQKIAWTAALQRGRAQRRAWDAAFSAWLTWKETGVAPHVRAAELEQAL